MVTTLGSRTLLVNPPLVDGIAYTRQGRCQEREEVLGTTKPPYTLALLAALLLLVLVRPLVALAGVLAVAAVVDYSRTVLRSRAHREPA